MLIHTPGNYLNICHSEQRKRAGATLIETMMTQIVDKASKYFKDKGQDDDVNKLIDETFASRTIAESMSEKAKMIVKK